LNNIELQKKVRSAMYTLIKEKGIASPVEVLLIVGVLSKEDYERWRFGKVDYLERVCKVNLGKLSAIMREIRLYAKKANLKPSWTDYRKWGTKNSQAQKPRLQFSKSGNEQIERQYATHYVNQHIVKQAKERKEPVQTEE
jgi:hypothetical protein